MPIAEKINFPVKTLDGKIREESTTLTLNIPDSYKSNTSENKSNYIIYRAFQKQLTNARQGTASTKTRAEVRGGGRKPRQQKGTGRARAGSIRSPLWKGGGVSFGPKPKVYSQKINRKEWRLSLRLLFLKKQKNISVVESFKLDSHKTKHFIEIFSKIENKFLEKIIIIVSKNDENLRRASKNLKNINILQADCLNIKELLLAKSIIITKESLKIIEETYNNG